MTKFAIGLWLFFGPHLFSTFRGARERLVQGLGAGPYRGLYSLLSIAGFVLIVMGYGDLPRTPLWTPPPAMRWLTLLLMLPVFVLLAAAYVPGHIKARLRNPMLIAIKTWAFAHLLSNGDSASLLLFGSFLAYAVIDLIAVKRSGRSPVVAHPQARFDAIAVGVGLALYALFVVWLHRALIGVPLLP